MKAVRLGKFSPKRTTQPTIATAIRERSGRDQGEIDSILIAMVAAVAMAVTAVAAVLAAIA